MFKKSFIGAYEAPVCEVCYSVVDAVLCESPSANTEEFGGTTDFIW
ncbi:MAG: hypothetical protein IJS66_05265 [Bacteroidales bacterium]|nr:hypothetical protein [Bacteroidales bacterium]